MNDLKTEMLKLIELSAEIAKYNEMLLHYLDINDKRNYDPIKAEKIRLKITAMQLVYYKLYEKWF